MGARDGLGKMSLFSSVAECDLVRIRIFGEGWEARMPPPRSGCDVARVIGNGG